MMSPNTLGIPLASNAVHTDHYHVKDIHSNFDNEISQISGNNPNFRNLIGQNLVPLCNETLYVIFKSGESEWKDHIQHKFRPQELASNFYIVLEKIKCNNPHNLLTSLESFIVQAKNNGVVFSKIILDLNIFAFVTSNTLANKFDKNPLRKFNLPTVEQVNEAAAAINTIFRRLFRYLTPENHLELIFSEILETPSGIYTRPHCSKTIINFENVASLSDRILLSLFTKLKGFFVRNDKAPKTFNITTCDSLLTLLAHFNRELNKDLDPIHFERLGMVYAHGYYGWRNWFQSHDSAQSILFVMSLINLNAITYFMHHCGNTPDTILETFQFCTRKLKISYVQAHSYHGRIGYTSNMISQDCVHWRKQDGSLIPLPSAIIEEYENKHNEHYNAAQPLMQANAINHNMLQHPNQNYQAQATNYNPCPVANIPHTSHPAPVMVAAPLVASNQAQNYQPPTTHFVPNNYANRPSPVIVTSPHLIANNHAQQFSAPPNMVLQGPYVAQISQAQQQIPGQMLPGPFVSQPQENAHFIQQIQPYPYQHPVAQSEPVPGPSCSPATSDKQHAEDNCMESSVPSENSVPEIQHIMLFLSEKFNQITDNITNIHLQCTNPNEENTQLKLENERLQEKVTLLENENRALKDIENDYKLAQRDLQNLKSKNDEITTLQSDVQHLNQDKKVTMLLIDRLLTTLGVHAQTQILPAITKAIEKDKSLTKLYNNLEREYRTITELNLEKEERLKALESHSSNRDNTTQELRTEIQNLKTKLSTAESNFDKTKEMVNALYGYLPAGYPCVILEPNDNIDENYLVLEEDDMRKALDSTNGCISLCKDIIQSINTNLSDPSFKDKSAEDQAFTISKLISDILDHNVIKNELTDANGFLKAIRSYLDITHKGPLPANSINGNKKRKT
jgi:hypothetical protein